VLFRGPWPEISRRADGAGPSHARRFVLALAFFSAWLGVAAAHDATWETRNIVGIEAFQQGHYPEAAGHFEAALSLADGEAASDQQVGALLYNLAGAYLASARYDEVGRATERWDGLLSANPGEPWVADQQAARSALLAVMERLQVGPGDLSTGAEDAREFFAVHLASVQSQADAGAEWSRLQKRYPEMLGPRTLLTKEVNLNGQGAFVRVLAGAFHSQVTARNICKYFERAGQYCAVVRVETGDP
jgi:tetratricopeptide (TPR) repeat protein